MMENIASFIEHTTLRPEATMQDVKKLVEEAEQFSFAAICIPPHYVRDTFRILGEHNKLKLCTVIGFPMGYSATSSKSEEIKRAVDEGADEVDAVINLAAYRSKQTNHFENDVQSMIRATHLKGKKIKIILETSLMQEQEILEVSMMCKEMGANFIKTGTGYFGPTKVSTVRFLKENLPAGLEIKAAGGIRTLVEARAMIQAGADRIGTSNALGIMAELGA